MERLTDPNSVAMTEVSPATSRMRPRRTLTMIPWTRTGKPLIWLVDVHRYSINPSTRGYNFLQRQFGRYFRRDFRFPLSTKVEGASIFL